MDVEEVWEYLEIWAAGGNAEARKLLVALTAAVERALTALEQGRSPGPGASGCRYVKARRHETEASRVAANNVPWRHFADIGLNPEHVRS